MKDTILDGNGEVNQTKYREFSIGIVGEFDVNLNVLQISAGVLAVREKSM